MTGAQGDAAAAVTALMSLADGDRVTVAVERDNQVLVTEHYRSRDQLLSSYGTQDTSFGVRVRLDPEASQYWTTTVQNQTVRGANTGGVFGSHETTRFSGSVRVYSRSSGTERGQAADDTFRSDELVARVTGALTEAGWSPAPRRSFWAKLFGRS